MMPRLMLAAATAAFLAAASAAAGPSGPQTAEAGAKSFSYAATSRDTLWSLARRFYGDPTLWRAIARANPALKDPDRLRAGTVLTIPLDLASAATAPRPRTPAPALPIREAALAAPKPAAVALAPAPAAAPLPAAPAPRPPASAASPLPAFTPIVLHETMPPEDRFRGVSETMPPPLASPGLGSPAHIEPLGWHPDGVVRDRGRVLAAAGDEVDIRWDSEQTLSPGSAVYIVRPLGGAFDPLTHERTGVRIQTLALVRITAVPDPYSARGVIEQCSDGVEPGAEVQTAAP